MVEHHGVTSREVGADAPERDVELTEICNLIDGEEDLLQIGHDLIWGEEPGIDLRHEALHWQSDGIILKLVLVLDGDVSKDRLAVDELHPLGVLRHGLNLLAAIAGGVHRRYNRAHTGAGDIINLQSAPVNGF